MALERILEEEVMDTPEEATVYNAMDHQEINALFVDDLLMTFQEFYTPAQQLELFRNADIFEDKEEEPLLPFLGNLLDIGTGTALIPIELCRREVSCRIMAVDMATSMLDLAQINIGAVNYHDRITLGQQDAKATTFEDDLFEVVMSNSIIHHVPTPKEAFAEMVRVLKPGGFLFIRDLARPASHEQLDNLVQTHAGEEDQRGRQMFAESLHAALTLKEVQAMANDFGFSPDTVTLTSDRHWTLAAKKPF
ncbi:MAG: class I SAM-dependent methyltransferase [Pirellulaceae bacterium]|nr:class I SAM-dependent methyltransferase [Pirellulaceae bacterium]